MSANGTAYDQRDATAFTVEHVATGHYRLRINAAGFDGLPAMTVQQFGVFSGPMLIQVASLTVDGSEIVADVIVVRATGLTEADHTFMFTAHARS